MKITVLFFGQLTDITGCATMEIAHPETVSKLKNWLIEKFPSMEQSKYMIAINNKMIVENCTIPENAIVALMPPFSGG